MSDTTLNQFVARGTAAARAAFTPDPGTPAAGPDHGYFWYETDTGDTYSWDGSSWEQVNAGGSPGSHASTHENGGPDELSVAGLSGTLADPQTPVTHKARHENGGDDEISIAGLSGEAADPQPPKAHATSHENSGSDEIDITQLAGYSGEADEFLSGDGTFKVPSIPAPPTESGTYLAAGGQVIWETGLQFRVSAASYFINGEHYTSAEQTVTLDAADGSDDRTDVIYLDTAGLAGDVTGTPGTNPAEPSVDPETQLRLVSVSIPATATEPPSIGSEDVYLEDAGSPTEWDATSSAGSVVVNSANNPRTGSVCIEGTAVPANVYVDLVIGSGALTPSDYDFFVFYARPKASWQNGRGWSVRLYSGSVPIGSAITVSNGNFGFQSATLAYQQVAIPVELFTVPTGTTITAVRITRVGGGNIGFYLDDITFLGSATTPGGGGGGLSQEVADTLYASILNKTHQIQWTLSGGGSPIATGAQQAYVTVPVAHTVRRATIFGDDDIVIDVWRRAYASHPPTVGQTITASAKPTLSGVTKNQDSTLTGWNTVGSAGDVYEINVDSADATKATLILEITIP